jgi:hypothetical protein
MSQGLKEYTKLNRYYKMKEMFEFLEALKESGITNMFGASPFIWMGKSMIEHEFKYKDIGDEEKFEEVLSLASRVRNNLIYGASKKIGEKTDIDDDRYFRSIESIMRRDAQDILKTWMLLKGSRTIRESEEKLSKISDHSKTFLRRFDGKKFDKKIREYIIYSYRNANNVNEFVEIILDSAVSAYLQDNFQIDTETWGFEDFQKIIRPLKEVYESLLKMMYYNERRKRR